MKSCVILLEEWICGEISLAKLFHFSCVFLFQDDSAPQFTSCEVNSSVQPLSMDHADFKLGFF